MTSALTTSMAESLRKLLDSPHVSEKDKDKFRRLLERFDEGEDDDLIESCCA